MKVVSINLNKRLKNSLPLFEEWLIGQNPDIILAQEPWSHGAPEEISIKGFCKVGGDSNVFCWARDSAKKQIQIDHQKNYQKITIGYLDIYNIYLPSDSSKKRVLILKSITDKIQPCQPSVLLGDFNIALNSTDGVMENKESEWTSGQERIEYKNLLERTFLVDVLRKKNEKQEFTIERNIGGKTIRFRCDLALVSDVLEDEIKAEYNHDTRLGKRPFTDHSAITVDIPLSITTAVDLFGSTQKFYPHKTAIHRTKPSKSAQELCDSKFLSEYNIKKILDYGCGIGSDVLYYRSLLLEADGYDPYTKFGWEKVPKKEYDLVTINFVLNVLENPRKRIMAVWDASRFVKEGGCMLITTRSPYEIKDQAVNKNWKRFNDGYISDVKKMTFQKGISEEEIKIILRKFNFLPTNFQLKLGKDTSCVIAKRQPTL